MQYHQNDESLIETAKLNKDYSIKHFHVSEFCKYTRIYV